MGAVLPMQAEYDFWNTSKQDRVFRRLFFFLLVLSIAFGALIYIYQVPPQALLDKPKVKPSITQIQLKKEPIVEPKPEPVKPKPPEPKAKEPPKVEPPKAEAPKPKPKAVEPPKVQPPQPKPEPVKPTPSPVQQREAARAKAQTRGLAAVDMSGLTAAADAAPQASASKIIASQGNSSQSRERLYAASAQQASTDLAGSASSSSLDARMDRATTGGASSNAGGGDAVLASGNGGGGSSAARAGQRDEASVRRVFEQSKSSASALYNRALRKNPTMSGRVTFEVVISPGGQVTSAKILDSQLNDAGLERKLLLKVRSLQFGAQNVSVLKLTYSYDFLPT